MHSSSHSWRFFRAGGFDQVQLARGADLAHLAELDQKLWVALSCPVQGLEHDARTLQFIDSDGDGQVRAPELIAAVDWALARLKSADTLMTGGPLALSDMDDSRPEGRLLLAAAQAIHASLGKAAGEPLSVEDCADRGRILAGMDFNGDGVVTPGGLDEDLQATVNSVVALLGDLTDHNGETGINRALLTRYFDEARALLNWYQQTPQQADCLPLGEQTAAAERALAAVLTKVDDFFLRCRLAAFDPRAGDLLNSSDDALRSLGGQLLSSSGGTDMAALPLAFVRPGAELPWADGLNPAWAVAIDALRTRVVEPLLGSRASLTETDWTTLKARLASYRDWQAAKPATALEALSPADLETLLASDAQSRLSALMDLDEAGAAQAALIADVEKLARLVRDLAVLAHNFVAFTHFYTRRGKAIFQAGTLYLDGRSCELCVKVLDPAKHTALATLSGVYLAYCECRRPGATMTIAAAFTSGDSDQLMVGRNGVFYDREGRDWDATITKIIDHPISIRQAFWSPYKKLARLVGEQVHKWAQTKAKAADELTAKTVTSAGSTISAAPSAAGKPPTAAPFDAAKFAGIFAAIGLAIGAIGTVLASVVSGFISLKLWQMPLALAGMVLLVSGPSMLLAYFKLRNRHLGPLLDANGWAVNSRARINIPFGNTLTQVAELPQGAEHLLADPYGEKAFPWKTWLAVTAVVAGLLISLPFAADIKAFFCLPKAPSTAQH